MEIKSHDIEAVYPLTSMQEGMLFHTLDAPASGVYVNQSMFEVEGHFDVSVFERAWNSVINRHAVLRSAFTFDAHRPVQIVFRSANAPFSEHDLRQLCSTEQQNRIGQFLAEDRQAGFHLPHAPLMRLTLFRTGDSSYTLIWTNHHILMDGWSSVLVLKEAMALYDAYSNQQELALPAAKPFQDYVEWLQRQSIAAARRYWRKALSGFASPTPLPQIESPSHASSGQDRAFQVIPEATLRLLQQLAVRHRCTLNTIAQSLWGLLLSRYAGEDDVVFGATVSGRPPELAGVETMVGLFVNTLPVRLRCERDLPAMEWFQRLQTEQADARQFEHTPLVEIQGWSDLPRGVSLFDTLFVFENFASDAFEANYQSVGQPGAQSGLRVRAKVALEMTNYPLTLAIGVGREMRIRATYEKRRFTKSAMDLLLRKYKGLFDQLATLPGKRVGELGLWEEGEREEWVAGRNRGPQAEQVGGVVSQFCEQARLYPERVAVSEGARQISYGGLWSRAEAVRRELERRGIGAEQRVAAYLERGGDLIAAFLGIQASGAVYVPLDPGYPGERLRYMAGNAGAALVISEESLAGSLPVADVPVMWMEQVGVGAGIEAGREWRQAGARQLAYVLYTSGSTGKPKGVMVEQGGMWNHLQAKVGELGLGGEDRVGQNAPSSFDISVWQMLAGLMAGGRVEVIGSEQGEDGEELLEAVERRQVTVLETAPAMLGVLLEQEAGKGAERRRLGGLRWLISNAEALPAHMCRQWGELYPESRLMNAYGPTECSDDVTHWVAGELGGERYAPLGQALRNTALYVVDEQDEPVPVGVPGEVLVGGAGVGRGYWKQARATAEKFVPDGLSGALGGRLYRTGDRGRWRQDGALEYLGRIDEQVKVRGYRIELGEIEAVLGSCAGVQQAAAAVEEDGTGQKRLVGYVVEGGAGGRELSEYRRELQEQLPGYMVPAALVKLARMPLTPNGKLDRKALPSAAGEWIEPAPGQYVAPRTAAEQTLAAIWEQVLRRQKVGVEENFFELGGDSILSLQIVARARQAGLAVSVRDLFQQQRIAPLARLAEGRQKGSSGGPEAAPQGVLSGAMGWTPIQRWFWEQGRRQPHHYNQAVLLQAAQPLQRRALAETVAGLLDQHDMLRLRVENGAGRMAARETTPVLVEIDLREVAEADQSRVQERVAGWLQQSLDLERGPATRLGLVRRSGSERLLWVAHHLAVDGVSWRILIEDLESGYEAACRGQKWERPAKSNSYAQWAEELSRYAASEKVTSQIGYWQRVSESGTGQVPRDLAGGENRAGAAAVVEGELGAEWTQRLVEQLGGRYRAGVREGLLAAVAAAVGEWSGQERIRIEVEGHGREEGIERMEVSRTVGWFTSLYPVGLETRGASAGERIGRVQRELEGAPDNGIGYGLLRYQRPDAPLASVPASDILFNYLGQLDSAVATDGLFQPASGPTGPSEDAGENRTHLLEIISAVVNEKLILRITYGTQIHLRSTIERMAAETISRLEAFLQPASGSTDLTVEELASLGVGIPEIQAVHALSPMQQGILFHTIEAPGSGVYFLQSRFQIDGRLQTDLFRLAWDRVVERHEILRTSFVLVDRPLQVVLRTARPELVIEDWRTLPPEAQSRRLVEFQADDRRRGFDLSRAPLLRIALFRIADNSYQFSWTTHHLVMDAWSAGLTLKEVIAHYDALQTGRDANLSAVRPFGDYVEWLQRQNLASAEQYWRKALAGLDAPTPVPGEDKPAFTDSNGRVDFRMSNESTAVLQQFCKSRRLTLNTIIQGAWALLLGRYSGLSDIMFGAAVSGRPASLEGAESIVGVFVNTLPVRLRLPASQRVVEWLSELQVSQAEARQYEYAPLVAIQSWSGISRGTPLFETLMVFQNAAQNAFESTYGGSLSSGSGAPLRVAAIDSEEATHYPLTLTIAPGEGLRFIARYATKRYSDAAILRILQRLERILLSIAAAPETTLGSLNLLSEVERETLRNASAPTLREMPPLTLPELFALQCTSSPEAIALVFGDMQITYACLRQRVLLMASRLIALGAGLETPVAVCLERGLDMVAALLAVVEAGACYVPLDPQHPKERLGYVLDDSKSAILITSEALVDGLPAAGIRVLLVETLPATPDTIETEHRTPASLDNLAYVLYTSGSTGRPKGVAVSHRALSNFLFSMREKPGIHRESTLLAITTVSFDIAALELFLPLIAGARIVMASRSDAISGAGLAALIDRSQTTILQATPATWRLLVESGWEGHRELVMLCGGEALSLSLSQSLAGKGAELWNLYGPTETTIWSLMEHVADYGSAPPIGAPIANTPVYVADSYGGLAPEGMPGELLIGGTGLARGYLRRPALTAAQFIPDPFSGVPGARLYRTGDRVVRSSGERLEFLGRIDNQIKLRGYRIELGEIERTLELHPGVKQAVVLLREDQPGNQQLVAYLVAEQDKTPPVSAIRDGIRNSLPSYMVPAVFEFLDHLPLTPNGKINRKALPKPVAAIAARSSSLLSPLQELIAQAWSELLGVSSLTPQSNFFESGGHSLLAMQIVARLGALLECAIPVQLVFEHPALVGFANAVEQIQRQGQRELEPPPVRLNQHRAPLSFAQQRLWFIDQLTPGNTAYNMPEALRLQGALDVNAVRQAIDAIHTRHESLRTAFFSAGSEPWQEVREALPVALPLIDLTALPGASSLRVAKEICRAESQRAFNLSSGQLLRAALLKLGQEDYALFLNVHHIASDAWSSAIFLSELTVAYESYRKGEQPPLGDLALQYSDFASWQRSWMSGEVLREQLEYWKRSLDPPPPPLFERRPENKRGTSGHCVVTIDDSRIRSLCRKTSTTPYMILLAAWQIVLHRFTGVDDIAIGSPVANRRRREFEGLIGFFTNTLVLRATVAGDVSVSDFLSVVRKATIGAFAHQDLPFDRLVEELALDREAGENPLFQAAFAFQDVPHKRSHLGGLRMAPLDQGGTDTPPFDLTLYAGTGSQGLRLDLEYDSGLFENEVAQRIVDLLVQVLSEITLDTTVPLSRIGAVDELERKSLVQLGQTARLPRELRHAVSAVAPPWDVHSKTLGILLLDAAGQLVHRGALGEVYISFGETGTARSLLLRTGELARWTEQGELELCGSGGQSAIVAGRIVDLSAMSAALRKHPLVHDCAVIVRTSQVEGRELCAYVVSRTACPADQLRAHLESHGYAETPPTVWMAVSHIPLSRSGGIDRAALERVPVIDEFLQEECKQALLKIPGVREAAALAVNASKAEEEIPVSQLIPGHRVRRENVLTAQTGERDTETAGPSLSRGPTLKITEEHPGVLRDALVRAAQFQPARNITHFTVAGTECCESYEALMERAERILTGLRHEGLRPGDKLILQIESTGEFLGAFWACMLGGFVAVPVAIAPGYAEVNATVKKLQHAWELLGAPLILASDALASAIRHLPALLGCEHWKVAAYSDTLHETRASDHHQSDPEDLALLLLTSGSTGKPKAVMLHHRNILHRSAAFAQAFDFTCNDVVMNWMPLDHVGGLVMYHCLGVYLCASQVEAANQAILQDPLQWMELCSKHKVTTTWAPNFAYEFFSRSVEACPQRNWDLSSMRFILNAGEAVSAKIARRFLANLAPYGMPGNCMFPAWGMSETTSGVTHSSIFTVSPQDPAELPWVEVGPPLPGVSLRLVDLNGAIVPEGTQGHLQVHGPTITSGYYANPAQTAATFTEDGWLRTGDLGVLRQGCLTITGRSKDELVLNGVNFTCHQIETAVEEVPGVLPGNTAAVAVRRAEADTEELAVFFCASAKSEAELLAISSAICRRVGLEVGAAPNWMFAIEEASIPRTGIGKIQRSMLRDRFEAGEYDANRNLASADSGAESVPSWFYRVDWRPRQGHDAAKKTLGLVFIFGDRQGFASHLASELSAAGTRVVLIESGDAFAQIDRDRYVIRPDSGKDYARLCEEFRAANVPIDRVYECRSYGAPDLDDGQQLAATYAARTVLLAKALLESGLSSELFFAASGSQLVRDDDSVFEHRGALAALLNSLSQHSEPWTRVMHIDFEGRSAIQDAALILAEGASVDSEVEVAYRHGKRLVRRLRRADLTRTPMQDLPFLRNGNYLLAGGLGGLGLEVARFLLTDYEASLLLVGRTKLEDNPERRAAFEMLQSLPGSVRYAAADISDGLALEGAVLEFELERDSKLAGALHSADILTERSLLEETPETLAAGFAAKCSGAENIARLLRRGSLFVAFSSVNSYFGGAQVGAYAAANRSLESFCAKQRGSGRLDAYSYAWSQWDDIGLGRGYKDRELTRAAGFALIPAKQGLHSLLAALARREPHLLIGLDGTSRRIRMHVDERDCAAEHIELYYAANSANAPEMKAYDRFGVRVEITPRQLAEFPRTGAGEIDLQALRGLRSIHRDPAQDEPQTETERRVASVWRQVLGRNTIAMDANFFELGGHSLLATQIISRLRQEFGVQIPVRMLFEASTVRAASKAMDDLIAAHQLEPLSVERIEAPILPVSASDQAQLLASLDQLTEEEVDRLLGDFASEGTPAA